MAVPDSVQAPALPYSPLWGRAIAALLDVFALIACFVFAGAVAASRFGGWTPSDGFSIEGGPAVLAIVAGVAAWIAFYALFEWAFGATPGKWAAGLRVTTLKGSRPSLARALIRNLVRLLDGVGFYLLGAMFVLLTKRRQRLGDLLAGTVVTTRRTAPASRAAAVLCALALPLASFGTTWLLGMPQAASNRFMSGGSTRLHGEASYTGGVTGKLSLDGGKSEIHAINEGTASGKVVHQLVMERVRFAVGKDGPERPSRVFKPGETVFLLFNLSGLAADSRGRTRMKARVLDPKGADLVQAIEREDDVPAGVTAVQSYLQFTLPTYCLAGRYRMDVVIEEPAATRRVEASIPFSVDAAAR